MRIVDVCAFYSPHGGGVRTYVHRKLAAAAVAGHEMIILAPGEQDATIPMGDGSVFTTIATPKLPFDRRYHYFSNEAALHRALDVWNPDVVEASSPWSSASMVARWPRPAIKSLIMHADPMSAYAYRWFGRIASTTVIDKQFGRFWRYLRRLDDELDLVISASADLSRRLTQGGLGKVITMPMGVEPGIFSPDLRDDALRARLLADCNLPESATLLLGVGRYSAEKRWGMVIDAAISAGIKSPIGLILVGDGRGRRGLITRTAGSPHVRVRQTTKNRQELAILMASADALVHGCEAETFCMVAAEARASGLAIIAPDRGGAADHVHLPVGRRYRAGDAASLREAIAHFAQGRSPATTISAGPAIRTMDDHFRDLFAMYEALRPDCQLAA